MLFFFTELLVLYEEGVLMKKMQLMSFVFMVAMFMGFSEQVFAFEGHSSVSMSDTAYQERILYYVNEYRSRRHLRPLKMNHAISKEAAKHSRDMASNLIPFGHAQFDGRIQRLYKQVKKAHAGAENVAYYKLDAKKLVDAWIASPGHRRNIEGNYNLTGIGIAHGRKGWAYYTQIFLREDNRVG